MSQKPLKKTAQQQQQQQQMPMATTLGQQKPLGQELAQNQITNPTGGAPTNAVEELDVFGEIPQARFGHTITLVHKTKVVLFGGATGDTGKYSMTGETYLFNILSKTWSKLNVKGVPPSPRAAHSSTNVEQMQMVVYGGATGGGSLASDDLYLLDMRNGEEMAQWMIVPVVGSTPGRRYGHTIIFSKPHLLVFGGNTGQEPVNDVWCLSVEKAPFSWIKLDCGKENPLVRVYHSAALCQTGSATGMMVVFGGRTADQSSLNDSWGLRRHRDGRWDWVKAPYKASGEQPTPRYQHSTLFLGPLMMVIGGRTNQVGEIVPLEVYDTESSEWYKFNSLQRFRHACWSVDSNVYVHGGFEHETPNIPINIIARIETYKLFHKHEHLIQKIKPIEKPNKKDASGKDIKKNTPSNIFDIGQEREFSLAPQAHIAMSYTGTGEAPAEYFSMLVRQISIDKLQEEPKKLGPNYKNPVTVQKNPHETLCSLFMKTLLKPKDFSLPAQGSKFPLKREDILDLVNECINILAVQPTVIKQIKPPVKVFGNIFGNYADLMRFFDIWGSPSESETGDIQGFDYVFLGNYVDRGAYSLEIVCLLMALKLKYPKQIFLLRGNHEDRNVNRYLGFGDECQKRLGEDINLASSVFAKVNDMFDYLPLAAIVQDKQSGNKIFCVHGGIGSTVMKVEDIEKINRPLQINLGEITTAEQQLVVDLLWSDPNDNEEEGISPNLVRDPMGQNNIVKFGPDRVDKFLKTNQMSMIIRSHQVCPDGLDRFAQGQLITINSCTDYCNKYGNDASFIVIQKKIIVSPKIIKPTNQSKQNWNEIQQIPENANSSVRRPLTPIRQSKLIPQ